MNATSRQTRLGYPGHTRARTVVTAIGAAGRVRGRTPVITALLCLLVTSVVLTTGPASAANTGPPDHVWAVSNDAPVALDADGNAVGVGACVLRRWSHGAATADSPPNWVACPSFSDAALDHYRLHPGVAREEARRVTFATPAVTTAPPKDLIVGLNNRVTIQLPNATRTWAKLQGSELTVELTPAQVMITVGAQASGPLPTKAGGQLNWRVRPRRAGPTTLVVVVVWDMRFQSTVWSDPTGPWIDGPDVWTSSERPIVIKELGTVRR